MKNDKNYNSIEIENSEQNKISNSYNNNNDYTQCALETNTSSITSNINLTTKSQNKLRSFGNLKCFFFYKNEPLIVIGPHWGFYLTLTIIFFLLYCTVFVYFKDKMSHWVYILGNIIYFFHLIVYTVLAFQNPGIPLEKNFFLSANAPDSYKQCSVCGCYVNLELDTITYHCGSCNVCIEDYDHHCPWTTKCIGRGNAYFFYLFIFASFLFFVMVFFGILVMD
jgi:palmitoyltransferase ZDHHC9/14/18